MPAKKSFTYPIRSYHADANGRLFVHQLFNFLQDTAHQHADGLGFGHQQLIEQDLFWVLSRLTIEVTSLPVQGDEIQLTTWVKSIRGSVSEREFILSLNDQVLVKASSLWFCLSAKTHKPTRVPAEYLSLMVPDDNYATSGGTEKIVTAAKEHERETGNLVTARYSDTDMVNHVNNAVYIRWALDCFDVEHFNSHYLTGLSVNYLNECFAGEELRVYWWQLTADDFIHELVNEGKGEIICRVKTIWLPNPQP